MAKRDRRVFADRNVPEEDENGLSEEGTPKPPPACWLCGRPFGETVVSHHPVPKSRGGKRVVQMHAICQGTLQANFTNSELARIGEDVETLRANPAIEKFIAWVANKEPDFFVPTRKGK